MEKRISVTRKPPCVIAEGISLIFPLQVWITVRSFSGEKRGRFWDEEAKR